MDKILDQEGYIQIEDVIAMRTAALTKSYQDCNHVDANHEKDTIESIHTKKKRQSEDDDLNKSTKQVKVTTTTTCSFPIELGESSTAAFSPRGMGQRRVDGELFDLSTIAEGDPSHSKEELPPFVAPPKYDKIPREERLARLRAARVSCANIHANEHE
ncbi:unnamed protein product [Aphanomyces euteiches]